MLVLVSAVVMVVLVVAMVAASVNRLVRARARVGEAWAQIDVELTRRHDLIPNLVQAVKASTDHERSTVEAVLAARDSAMTAQASHHPGMVAGAETGLDRSVGSLIAVAQQYPQLRAGDSFRVLQEQLTECEDKLEYARHFYNTSVRKYNTAIAAFPSSIAAKTMHYEPAEFFRSTTPDTPPQITGN